jgi:hypothetical protein
MTVYVKKHIILKHLIKFYTYGGMEQMNLVR